MHRKLKYILIEVLKNGRVMNIVHNSLYIKYLYSQKINYFTNHTLDK